MQFCTSIAALLQCYCADGACEWTPASIPVNPRKENIICNLILENIQKQEESASADPRKGRQYVYNAMDLLLLLLRYRNQVQMARLRDINGVPILAAIVIENRPELVQPIFDAGLIEEQMPLKVTGTRFTNLSATEIANKHHLVKVQQELHRLKALDDSMMVLAKVARNGDVHKTKRLVKKHPEMINRAASDGTTPLYWGVTSGNLEVVEVLLYVRGDISVRSEKGDHILTRAVALKHHDMVEYLTASLEIHPDRPGPDGKTSLEIAIENMDQRMVNKLIDKGATITSSVLTYIAKSGNVDFLRKVLREQRGLNIEHKDRLGKSPLFLAAEKGHIPVIEELVKQGANFRTTDLRHRNIIHAAAESGNVTVLQKVLEIASDKGCLLDLLAEQDKFTGSEAIFLVRGRDKGVLAWHYVLVHRKFLNIFREKTRGGGSIDVAKFSTVITSGWGAHPPVGISKNMDERYSAVSLRPDASDDMTPLHLAIIKEHEDCALKLLEFGANVDISDAFGNTPLHLASMRGQLCVVAALTDKGAQSSARDAEGHLPKDFAQENGHKITTNFFNAESVIPKIEVGTV